MDMQLQVAMIGLVAALLGAWIGAKVAHLYGSRQARVSLTVAMFDRYQSLLPHRIAADDLLKKMKSGGTSLEYAALYKSLSAEEWSKVSHVRHFWGQLALLHEKKQLDAALASGLFAEDARYWWSEYFAEAERLAPPGSANWRKTWKILDPWISVRSTG